MSLVGLFREWSHPLLAVTLLSVAHVSPQAARAGVDPASETIHELQSLLDQGEWARAEQGAARLLQSLLDLTDRADSLVVLDATEILVRALLAQGRHEDMSLPDLVHRQIALSEALFDSDAVQKINARQCAGTLACKRRLWDEAIAECSTSVAMSERLLGLDDPGTASALVLLARAYSGKGDSAAARVRLDRALAIHAGRTPQDPSAIASTLLNLNEVRIAMGDTAGVSADYARAADLYASVEDPDGPRTADALSKDGIWKLRVHDPAGAAAVLGRAVAILARLEPRGSTSLADALCTRAQALLQLAKPDSAGACASQALELYEVLDGPEGTKAARCLTVLGGAERGAHRHEEARRTYDHALRILRGPPARDPEGLVRCLQESASLAVDLAREDEAVALTREAVEVAASSQLRRRSIAGTYAAHAEALRAAQQPDSAGVYVERALAAYNESLSESDPASARPLLCRAAIAFDRGDLARARADADRALLLRERVYGPNDPSLSPCLHQIGIVQRRLGDEVGAEASLRRAFSLAQAGAGGGMEAASILSSVAALERAQGDVEAAEAHYREALSILERELSPDHPRCTQVLRSLASLENAAGRFAEAEEHYERALRVLERTSPGSPELAATHLGLGNALKARGEREPAREHYLEAIEIHRRALGTEAAPLALDLYNLAVLLLESGDLGAAMDTACAAERLSLRHFRLVARGLAEREALFHSASRVRGTDIALTCASRSDSPAEWRKAWDLLVRSRAVVLDEMAERHRVRATAADPEVARLDSALAAVTNGYATLAVRGRGRRSQEEYVGLLETARREKEAAERALAERSEPYRSRRARQETGLQEVVAALPPGSALVAWVRFDALERDASAGPGTPAPNRGATAGQPAYAAFTVTAGAADVRFAMLGPAWEIERAISLWHGEAAGRPGPEQVQAAGLSFLDAGAALRRAVWDPAVVGLKGVERIFLVPDGMLAVVNFETLPDDRGRYFLEYGPPLQVLSSERDMIPEAEEVAPGVGLLTAAAPDYRQQSDFREDRVPSLDGRGARRGILCGQFNAITFDSLRGAAAEGREVSRLWLKHGSKVDEPRPGQKRPEIVQLTGPVATERAFKRLAPGRRLLHIATHGFFLGEECMGRSADPGAAEADELTLDGVMAESPLLLSGLAFAGANERKKAASAEDDGILTAEEIASLNLMGVDCVVLSACQTGLGTIEAGEGVFGMRRAFQAAGARSLVMSLWAVDDVATSQWMEAMFEHRLQRRRSVTEAVRAASLEILRKRRSDGLDPHPYYWGAFVTTGDWR